MFSIRVIIICWLIDNGGRVLQWITWVVVTTALPIPTAIASMLVIVVFVFGKQVFNTKIVWTQTDISTEENSKVTHSELDGQQIENILKFDANEIWPTYCGKGNITYPNFKTKNRRISEAKCLEYIWKTKINEHLFNMESECMTTDRGVVAGRDANDGEFPHMGAVGWISAADNESLIFKCGASLISEKFMLTAAHCSQVSNTHTDVANSKPYAVRLGRTTLHSNLQIRYIFEAVDALIKRLIIHEQYNSPKNYYDIALIELKHAVTFDENIRPACLWSKPDTSSIEDASISGWGVVDVATKKNAEHLQVANVNFINSSHCDSLLTRRRNRNWNGLSEHQICAGHIEGGIDSCQGDSGGPLQTKISLRQEWPMYYLIGVTSFGYGCALSGNPGIYTRVSSFIDWIEKNVWIE